jgi:hypothetical protein
MSPDDSRKLTRGNRVCWQGKPDDGGKITETNWNAVTITWDDQNVAVVHHGDMREIQRAR